MPSRRLNVSFLALALFAACDWASADMAADITASGLSADQVSLIETQTCRSWHARSIAGLRSESFPRTSEVRVSLECEFHDEYQGNRLASVGVCNGSGVTWKCETVGTLVEMKFSARQRSAVLYDEVPLPEGIELMRYLERASGKRGGLASSDLPGTIVHVFALSETEYLLHVPYVGFETAIHVDKRCNKRGCKYKIRDSETYQTFDDM